MNGKFLASPSRANECWYFPLSCLVYLWKLSATTPSAHQGGDLGWRQELSSQKKWFQRLGIEEEPQELRAAKEVMLHAIKTANEAKVLNALTNENLSNKAKKARLESILNGQFEIFKALHSAALALVLA